MKRKFKQLSEEEKQEAMLKILEHNVKYMMRAVMKMSASLGFMHDIENNFQSVCHKGSPLYVAFLKYQKQFDSITEQVMTELNAYSHEKLMDMWNLFFDALNNVKMSDELDTNALRIYIANKSAQKDIAKVYNSKFEAVPINLTRCTALVSLTTFRSRKILIDVSDQAIEQAVAIIDEIGEKIEGVKIIEDEVQD